MLENVTSAYFIGIKGVGMTAFAQILHTRGVRVSGSDTTERFFTDEVLRDAGISFTEGFAAQNVPDADMYITSPAYINSDNSEVEEIKRRGGKLVVWHDALAELFNAGYGIAVAGSHGKSTTTAMLGLILEAAGLDPTVVVGSRVNAWGGNARVGRSNYYVIEADEYRDAFLRYHPKLIALTNIDYDHPDYFPTKESYAMSFKKFMERVPADMLVRTPENFERFNLKIPGEHNQKNANLAYHAALKLGVDPAISRSALEEFSGIARRFEYYGEYQGAKLFDDYAHHPSEITALLQAAREAFPSKKIFFLFQPHTFSRTKGLFDEFVVALKEVDGVAILSTYGSARESGEDETGRKLAQALSAPYFASHKEAQGPLSKSLNSEMVLFTVGAGDAWQILKALCAKST